MTRRALAILVALAGAAHADDEPLADQKFDQAQKLRDAGKIAESCALFRESLQLNPNAIGTVAKHSSARYRKSSMYDHSDACVSIAPSSNL